MKPNKDISDLFKDNQHKLNESPSRHAWERLESRLDQHKDRNQWSIFRILSMAAAVVVLVVFVSVISFMLNPKADSMAQMELNYEGFATEELKVVSVSNESDNQLATYQRKYNNHLSSPIQEGKANKKLFAKMDIQRRDGNLNTFLERARREQPQSFAFSSTPAPESSTEAFESASPAGDVNIRKDNYAATTAGASAYDSIIFTRTNAADTGEDELNDFADGANMEADDVIKESKTAPSKKAKKEAEKSSAAKKDQSYKAKELSAASSDVGLSDASSTGIQDFQWLTGKWEGNINNQVSIEKWKQLDSKTLEGSGFLMINEQSIFQEKMKIQEIGGVIYFIADLNGTGNLIQYQLVSNDGFRAVFENQSIDFPNQVVLQRTNSSNFSTIYQNTEPGNINETQQNYYLNRNYIQKEQVIRNLRRVTD